MNSSACSWPRSPGLKWHPSEARAHLVKSVENPTLSKAERERRLGLSVSSTLVSRLLDSTDFRKGGHPDGERNGGFDRKNLTSLHARQLANLKNPKVTKLMASLWDLSKETPADVKAKIASYREAYAKFPPRVYNATAGKAHYQRLCMSCHIMGGEGGRLGPDLSGTWRNGVDYFLENIIDPNAVVGADYQLNLITQKDGTVTAGMIEKETDTTLVVRTVTDAVSVPKTEITGRQVTPNSLMPAGLLDSLSEEEANELIRFLTAPQN